MTDKAISPLRRRLIEDMTIRRLGPGTQLTSGPSLPETKSAAVRPVTAGILTAGITVIGIAEGSPWLASSERRRVRRDAFALHCVADCALASRWERPARGCDDDKTRPGSTTGSLPPPTIRVPRMGIEKSQSKPPGRHWHRPCTVELHTQ